MLIVRLDLFSLLKNFQSYDVEKAHLRLISFRCALYIHSPICKYQLKTLQLQFWKSIPTPGYLHCLEWYLFSWTQKRYLIVFHELLRFSLKISLTYFQDVSYRSQILYWIYFSQNELQPIVYGWLIPTLFPDKNCSMADEKLSVLQHLERLNNYLSTRTFLVGERISFADIAVSLMLLPIYEGPLDSATRQTNFHLTRWLTTCLNQKNFLSVLGKRLF